MNENYTLPIYRHSFSSLKRICLFCAFFCTGVISISQNISLSCLLKIAGGKNYTGMIRNLGFKRSGIIYLNEPPADSYIQTDTTGKAERKINYYRIKNQYVVNFQTVFADESLHLNQEISNEGYRGKTDTASSVFQKNNCVITACIHREDSTLWYNYTLTRTDLPLLKNIIFAEDLFQLDSHEFLVSVFGRTQVKKDIIYLSGISRNCSVIFPNTKYEAVFVWEDQENYRNIHSLRIGGDPQTKGSLSYERNTEQNQWRSREDIYIGMSLVELQKLSEHNSANSGLYEKIHTSGQNNFAGKIALLFNCLNCGDTKYFKADFTNFSEAGSDGRKVYVSTMIFMKK